MARLLQRVGASVPTFAYSRLLTQSMPLMLLDLPSRRDATGIGYTSAPTLASAPTVAFAPGVAYIRHYVAGGTGDATGIAAIWLGGSTGSKELVLGQMLMAVQMK